MKRIAWILVIGALSVACPAAKICSAANCEGCCEASTGLCRTGTVTGSTATAFDPVLDSVLQNRDPYQPPLGNSAFTESENHDRMPLFHRTVHIDLLSWAVVEKKCNRATAACS